MDLSRKLSATFTVMGAAVLLAASALVTMAVTLSAMDGTWAQRIDFNALGEGPIEIVLAWALLPAVGWMLRGAVENEAHTAAQAERTRRERLQADPMLRPQDYKLFAKADGSGLPSGRGAQQVATGANGHHHPDGAQDGLERLGVAPLAQEPGGHRVGPAEPLGVAGVATRSLLEQEGSSPMHGRAGVLADGIHRDRCPHCSTDMAEVDGVREEIAEA